MLVNPIIMNKQEIEKYKEAGKIAKKVVEHAKSIIKPGMLLRDIAEEIESKIQELGGEVAFPVNLSINDVAAHFTPSHDDISAANGLLKVDIGIHKDGFIADTAFTLDLEHTEQNKKLILASEKALDEAIKVAKLGIEIWKIGEKIQETITEQGFAPVRNLSGHQLGQYKIHAGLTIPNHNNGNETKLDKEAYAIEPFATDGVGMVYEGKPSGIYRFLGRKPVRDILARKLLDFIEQTYSTLPFCSRWIVKKFGTRSLISLNLLEQSESLHQYPELIEKSHGKVSQAEHTILIDKKTEVTT